jgi:uncharacterized membrane protein YbhN (UPF0104 family)
MNIQKIFSGILSVSLIILLLTLADLSAIVKNLSKANKLVYTFGVIVFLTTYPVAAYRWKKLCESKNYQLSLRKSFQIIAISYGFNKLFPGNAGDLARSKIFERYKDIENHGEIIGLVALERYFSAVALLLIILVSVAFTSFSIQSVKWLIIIFSIIISVLTLFLILEKNSIEAYIGIIPASNILKGIYSGLSDTSKKTQALTFLTSVYIRMSEAITFYLFIISLDIGKSFFEGAFVTSVMSLVSSLPLAPAGLGTVDATGVSLLKVVGVNYSSALSLVILERSVGLLLMAIVGILTYLIYGKKDSVKKTV